jgi:hypothetical protein
MDEERSQITGAYIFQAEGLENSRQVNRTENLVNPPQGWRQPFKQLTLTTQKVRHDHHQTPPALEHSKMLPHNRDGVLDVLNENGGVDQVKGFSTKRRSEEVLANHRPGNPHQREIRVQEPAAAK